jgi:hypothetical protein
MYFTLITTADVNAEVIAEANSKIIERLRQLFAEPKIVEFRGLQHSLLDK